MNIYALTTDLSAQKGAVTRQGSSKRALRSVLRMGVIAISLTTLAGCSSLTVGNSDFACPGMPDGVKCMSTMDVYAATNDGGVPLPMRGGKEGDSSSSDGSGMQQKDWPGGIDPVRDSVSAYVAPRLPDKPVPVRTPAEVMRIWVAPWEDTNGDLNVSGYLYTEVQARRWVLGDPAPSSNPVLSPLTVRPAPKPEPIVQITPEAQQPSAAETASTTTENSPLQEIHR